MRRSSAGVSRSRRSMRAISTLSMPQRVGACDRRLAASAAARREESARHWCRQSRGRGCSATSLRGVLRCADTPTARAIAGSSSPSVAMPGTTCGCASAASAITVSMMPAAAIRWPIAHLNAVTGGIVGAEHAPDRRRLGGVRLRRAVAVRDDHADIGWRELAHRASATRLRGEAVAVVADREQPVAFAGVAAAQHLAQNRRAALSRRTPPSPATARRRLRRTGCRLRSRSNGRIASARAARAGGSRARSAARSAYRGRRPPLDRPRLGAALPPLRSPPACRRTL